MLNKKTSHLIMAGLVTSLIAQPVLAQGTTGGNSGGGSGSGAGGNTSGGTSGGNSGSTSGGGYSGGTSGGTGGAGSGGGSGSSGSGFGGAAGSQGSGASGHEGHGAMSPMGQLMNASMDRLFALKSAQGNMAEIMESQLALRKSKNQSVRQFAQQMIQDHTRATTELTQLATQKGISLPRHIGVTHAAAYDQLSKLGGARFDQTYMGRQVEAHEAMMTILQHATAHGQDADIKAFASRILPHVMHHAAMAYNVARTVGAPGIQDRPQSLISGAAMHGNMAGTGAGGSSLQGGTGSLTGSGAGGSGAGGYSGQGSTGNTSGGNTGSGSGNGSSGGAGGSGAGGVGGSGGSGGTGNTGGGSGGSGNTGGGNTGGGNTGGGNTGGVSGGNSGR